MSVAKKKIRNKQEAGAILIWNVPNLLRHRFKAACGRRGKSMRSILISLMDGFAQQSE